MGGYHFEALYQQRPTAPTGTLFDVSQLEFVDFAPVFVEKRVRGWDKASTEGSGDFTVGVKMSKDKHGIIYVEDVLRGQWNTAKRDKLIKITAEIDGQSCKIVGEQEPGSGGKDAAGLFVKLLAGYGVTTELPSGSKEIRADPFSSQVNAGNVRLVRGPWNEQYIEEMRQFPRGRHDDQIDASALAFKELTKPVARFYSQ
jgi:predicted phage terminase large subunit-like protein